MVSAAIDRLRRSRLDNVVALRADMHRLPIATGSVDYALLSQSLQYAEAPGQVLSADKTGIVIGCGAQALRILRLQLEGGRRLTAQEFLAGHRLKSSEQFS